MPNRRISTTRAHHIGSGIGSENAKVSCDLHLQAASSSAMVLKFFLAIFDPTPRAPAGRISYDAPEAYAKLAEGRRDPGLRTGNCIQDRTRVDEPLAESVTNMLQ